MCALTVLAAILCPAHASAHKNVGAGSSSIPGNSYYEASVAYNYTSKTVEFCNGTTWGNLLGANAGITLGTSVIATNPSVTGDLTTGLFSAATSTVSIATGGVEALRVNSSGYVGIGTTAPSAPLTVNHNALGATQADGVYMVNSTAATSGVPIQLSPALHQEEQGWYSASSNNADFYQYLTDGQYFGIYPIEEFCFSINGGAVTCPMNLVGPNTGGFGALNMISGYIITAANGGSLPPTPPATVGHPSLAPLPAATEAMRLSARFLTAAIQALRSVLTAMLPLPGMEFTAS